MVEVVVPSSRIKGIGDEENQEVFDAAISAKRVNHAAKGTHDEHQPSSKFVFKHPRSFIRPSAVHEDR